MAWEAWRGRRGALKVLERVMTGHARGKGMLNMNKG